MNEKRYTVTLADGTKFTNLRLNGDNFISITEVTPDKFVGNCSPVVISDGETEETHENMNLVQVKSYVPGEYWFVLRDLSPAELRNIKMQSDIEYVAMMAGVDL